MKFDAEIAQLWWCPVSLPFAALVLCLHRRLMECEIYYRLDLSVVIFSFGVVVLFDLHCFIVYYAFAGGCARSRVVDENINSFYNIKR